MQIGVHQSDTETLPYTRSLCPFLAGVQLTAVKLVHTSRLLSANQQGLHKKSSHQIHGTQNRKRELRITTTQAAMHFKLGILPVG